MRKGFWDGQGANIASRYKKLYGVEVFLCLKHFCQDFVRSGGD